MIPVRIKKKLYIRKGSGKGYDAIGIAPASGEIIVMDGLKEDGDALKGVTKWYYKINDKNENQWYWGGRIEEVLDARERQTAIALKTSSGEQKFNPNTMSWAHNSIKEKGLGIVELWNLMESRGKGVNVTIIDTGIGVNIPDLSNVVNAPLDGGSFVANDPHGTLTAGVLGATGQNIVYGIAPECTITMINRIGSLNGLSKEEENIFHALQKVEKDTDILNLSFSCENTARINNEISRISQQGTIIIAATQDGRSKLNDSIFPANHKDVIPVTALGIDGQLYWQALFNSKTKWILPGEHIMSCGLNGGLAWHDATSAAAPVMSGLLALFVSLRKSGKLSFTNDQLFEQLAKDARKISFIGNENTFTFLYPDPIKTFTNLHSVI